MSYAKPIEQHRRNGNPGHKVLPNVAQTIALPSASVPPETPESLQTAGRDVWKRLWAHASSWLSPTTDLGVITRYCEAHDERQRYRLALEQDGWFSEGSRGQPTLHPAVKALRELDAQLLRYEASLGLTPADRGKLGYAEVKTASKLQQLIASASD